EDKIHALIHRRIPLLEIGKFKLDLEKDDAVLRVPEEAFYIEGLQIAKRGITTDIQHFFPAIKKIEFVETYLAPKKEKAPKKTSTKKTKAKRTSTKKTPKKKPVAKKKPLRKAHPK
ncbi:hypothetical protein KAU87_03160, partial [Candidatus Bathyarchaeota archaeon]|nr:hypothetical protein [Candidatus Bathyarchaeota archaeon]